MGYMSYIDKLEDLYKHEDFMKAIGGKTAKDMLAHSNVLNNPNATQAEKLEAMANIRSILRANHPNLPMPVSDTDRQRTRDQVAKLSEAGKVAKQKMDEINRGKQQKNISTVDKQTSKLKEQVAEERAENKKRKDALLPDQVKVLKDHANTVKDPEQRAKLEAIISQHEEKIKGSTKVPGSDMTYRELEAHAKRQDKDPNAWTPKEVKSNKGASPALRNKIVGNKAASTVKEHLDLANELHNNGATDDAHALLSQIPKEHYPTDMKDYNPAYIHYGLSPNAWSSMPHGDRQGTHEYHNEVMTGQHDGNPDPQHQAMISKVKAAVPVKPKI
jgi:hypothetical protein